MVDEFIDILKNNLNYLINTIEVSVESNIKSCIEKNYDDSSIVETTNNDLEITIDGYYFLVDVKYQNIDKTYSFPNMISIKKAKDILSDDMKNIIYVFIEYESLEDEQLGDGFERHKIKRVRVQPIETLDWDYLYIQNLGKGQLQIKNMTRDKFLFKNDVNRTDWLNTLKDKGIEYYNSLMLKVAEYKSEWEKYE